MSHPSRRALLRRSGAAAAAASLGSLAGCSGVLPFDDSPDPGTALAPDREPTYRRWLPAPDADDRRSVFGVRYLDARAVRDHRDRLPDSKYRRLSNLLPGGDHLGIAFADVEEVVHASLSGSISVVVGSHDPDAVADTLRGTGYETNGEYGAYSLYEGSLGQRAAVGEGAVIWAHERAADDAVAAVIDARRGDATRLHEHSDEFAALTEAVGRPDRLTAFVGDGVDEMIEITRASGYAYLTDFDGERTHRSVVVQFPEAEQAEALDGDALRDAVETRLTDAEPAVRSDGRTARLDGTSSTSEFDPDAVRPYTPSVTWDVAYDGSTSEAVVEHAAGDPVDAANLSLESEGRETDRQFADEYDTVEPGDAVTVEFESYLQIVWRDDPSVFTRRFEPS